MQLDDSVLLRQVTDVSARVELEDIVTDWSVEQAEAYYKVLERRIIGANVLINHLGRRFWLLGEGQDDVEQTYDTTVQRWHAITMLLPFDIAHGLASTATERRTKIREAVAEKLGTGSGGTPQS